MCASDKAINGLPTHQVLSTSLTDCTLQPVHIQHALIAVPLSNGCEGKHTRTKDHESVIDKTVEWERFNSTRIIGKLGWAR